jgi:hypothetical protein
MKVQTSGMMSGLTVKFELTDLSKADQLELFVMSLRNLGFDKTLSAETLKEIDAELIKVSK